MCVRVYVAAGGSVAFSQTKPFSSHSCCDYCTVPELACVRVYACVPAPHPTRYPDTMRSENLRLNWMEPALVAAFRSSGT